MNKDRLYQILNEATAQYRKSDLVRHEQRNGMHVVHIDAMPHVDEANPIIEKIDLELLVIGVDKIVAEKYRAELIALLNDYPQPERLRGGPSYIEVGSELGDQGMAFQLFAMGKVLGLWNIITPALFGMKGEQAIAAAGQGFIMITGYNPEQARAPT